VTASPAFDGFRRCQNTRPSDEAPHEAQRDPWFHTRSPEQAIHLCESAYYPHRLRLLGPSQGFGFTQRVTQVGPITVGDITYETDDALRFDRNRSSYHVHVPLQGWLESRHQGQIRSAVSFGWPGGPAMSPAVGPTERA
jgi:hypothetical protein